MEHSITRTYVGTTIYMAPERLRGGVYRFDYSSALRLLCSGIEYQINTLPYQPNLPYLLGRLVSTRLFWEDKR
ncbi:unnamed protein product [Haemonchus placei]|uniref:Protein kinase domain-containing protein n=1 Tax=Haemonchus placei TaxID=6290 RepID=A0A0N4WJ35_HAEPC|nr:unnamed protein product [Haemonchus placei]